MENYFANAFAALEGLDDIKIEPKKVITEAEEDDIEPSTLKDLFEKAGSYVLTHLIRLEGANFSIFAEGLSESGESLDVVGDEFDIGEIDSVLVELLDSENDFIGRVDKGDANVWVLNDSIDSIKEAAKSLIGFDNEIDVDVEKDIELETKPEEPVEEALAEEPIEALIRKLKESGIECELTTEDNGTYLIEFAENDQDLLARADDIICDSVGENYEWKIKSEFPRERNPECKVWFDECLKEEKVKTPRGEFELVDKTEDELKKDGFGFHHEHDGVKVFTKDNQAVAIKAECLKESHNPSFSELEEWCMDNPVEMLKTIERIRDGKMTDGDRQVFNDFGFDNYSKKELTDKLDELEDATYSWIYDSGDFDKEEIAKIEKEIDGILKEASSAEKKAFKNGGKDFADYIDGKAIARVKDPDERARLIAVKKLDDKGKLDDRPNVEQELDRKERQAEKSFEKKAQKMADKGYAAEECLSESVKADLGSVEQLEQADEILNKDENEHVEQIVDINAETVDDLDKTYLGSAILQCRTCKTLIYRDPSDLVKEETNDGFIYNKGDECPHCGDTQEGYDLIGQVAKLDVDPEEQPEPPMEETQEETPETTEEGGLDNVAISDENTAENGEESEITAIDDEEETNESLIGKEFDDERFNVLATKYLNEIYSNVSDFTTTSVKANDLSKVVIEGVIHFKSGKEKKTTFTFNENKVIKSGKVKLVGLNETFSKDRAFVLVGSMKDHNLIAESLSYSYLNKDKKIKGKVNY